MSVPGPQPCWPIIVKAKHVDMSRPSMRGARHHLVFHIVAAMQVGSAMMLAALACDDMVEDGGNHMVSQEHARSKKKGTLSGICSKKFDWGIERTCQVDAVKSPHSRLGTLGSWRFHTALVPLVVGSGEFCLSVYELRKTYRLVQFRQSPWPSCSQTTTSHPLFCVLLLSDP